MNAKLSLAIIVFLLLSLAVVGGFSLRQVNVPQVSPGAGLSSVRTEAVKTFAAELTGTAGSVPTDTLTATQFLTRTPVSTGSSSVTPACNNLKFVRDVTIPDNTAMTPAQVFTKGWLVENSGTCAWHSGFQVVLIGGLAMGGSPFKLAQDVAPGGRIQVSIKMAAPTNQTGIVQGTWKMADENGDTFGDYMSVVIVVSAGTGTSQTRAPSATP